MLSDEQRFLELSKQREALKEQLKTTGEELESLLTKIGVGSAFQDPADNTVFEIVIPAGTFIAFKSIGYHRTKRDGERSGTLAMKRAKELGFTI